MGCDLSLDFAFVFQLLSYTRSNPHTDVYLVGLNQQPFQEVREGSTYQISSYHFYMLASVAVTNNNSLS